MLRFTFFSVIVLKTCVNICLGVNQQVCQYDCNFAERFVFHNPHAHVKGDIKVKSREKNDRAASSDFPSRHALVQSQQWKHENFKQISYVVLVFSLLTLNK